MKRCAYIYKFFFFLQIINQNELINLWLYTYIILWMKYDNTCIRLYVYTSTYILSQLSFNAITAELTHCLTNIVSSPSLFLVLLKNSDSEQGNALIARPEEHRRMEFVVVPYSTQALSQASRLGGVRYLSRSQVMRAVQKEAKERAAQFPQLDPVLSSRLLSAVALRNLCLSQFSEAERQDLGDASNPEEWNAVWLDNYAVHGEQDTGMTCRVMTKMLMNTHYFDVSELLDARERLLVFMTWMNLDAFAHAHGAALPGEAAEDQEMGPASAMTTEDDAVASSNEEGQVAGASRGEELKESTPAASAGGLFSGTALRRNREDTTTPTTLSGSASVGVFPAKRLHKEIVFESVSAQVRHNDIEAVNELIDGGLPRRITHVIVPFACRECSHLPQFTLTMSCCGAVLCSRCVPSPPTVTDIAREERRCPICCEEPLEPPQSHPQRDEQVHRLVKELKVLYHNQLKDLSRLKGPQGVGDAMEHIAVTAPQGRLSPYTLTGNSANNTPILH